MLMFRPSLTTVITIGAFAGLAALVGYQFSREKKVDPPSIMSSYERADDPSFRINFQGYGNIFDFSANERTQISLALDGIPTEVLRRSGIRNILVSIAPRGPDGELAIKGDTLYFVFSTPAEYRNITSEMLQSMATLITNNRPAAVGLIPGFATNSHDAIVTGQASVRTETPTTPPVVVSPSNEPTEYTPVLNNNSMSRTGRRYNDTHAVSAVSTKDMNRK